MIKLVFILLCCGVYTFGFAQEKPTSFSRDLKTNERENKKFQSTQDVAFFILSKYSTEAERIKGIYSWVTQNIHYDKTGAFAMNAGPDKNAKVYVAFTRRRGVCENFAGIFNDICQKAGFQSYVIEGITQMNNQIAEGAHSWVTVQVNKEWYFFDPTWDEGGKFQYFMSAPEEFITTHIPFDPLWQFLAHPYNEGQVKKGSTMQHISGPLNFKDSLSAWLQMDSIGKLESAERRILNAASQNRNAKTNLSVVKMNLEIERQGEQVEWHDLATQNLNDAVRLMNTFIEFRNDLTLLQKSDAELKKLLTIARDKIARALEYLDKIDQSNAKLVMGTWPERERIVKLKNNLGTQESFLTQYLNTSLAERKALFYR